MTPPGHPSVSGMFGNGAAPPKNGAAGSKLSKRNKAGTQTGNAAGEKSGEKEGMERSNGQGRSGRADD
jgi:hypothetical protein